MNENYESLLGPFSWHQILDTIFILRNIEANIEAFVFEYTQNKKRYKAITKMPKYPLWTAINYP